MRVVFSALGATLLVAWAASPASSSSPTCSQAAARAAITQTKPRLALIGDKVLIAPEQAGHVFCFDVTGDGNTDMAVSIASRGTAGDIGWLLFVPKNARWRLAGSGTGYKLSLNSSGSKLEVVQPVYRAKDPNCCPTGGFDRTLYRWNVSRSRLVVVRAWHTKMFR
jgi:hypothetical protein